MSEQKDQLMVISDAIIKLSHTKEKMVLEDIKKETGIPNPEEILKQLRKSGFIYYVNSSEFKLTP